LGEVDVTFDLGSVLDVLTGVGSSGLLAEGLDPAETLVVIDGALADLPHLSRLVAAGNVITVSAGEPTVASVQDVVDRARCATVGTVVAIGGGSALDTGKITAAMLGNERPVTDHLLSANPVERSVRLIGVPTTAGSGAEVTRTCVLSHEGRKSWMWDQALVPDTVVLDPELTVGMPTTVTVATGLDAFVHAVEAFTNVVRDETADRAALAAVATIPGALTRVVASPEDVQFRRLMLEAATTAGVAIDRCGTALAHCVGHALAGLSKIPHGLAVALGLRATLEWSMPGDQGRYAAVADAIRTGAGVEALTELTDELYQAVGFDEALRVYAVEPLDADALAASMESPENRPMAAVNARAPQPGDLADISLMVADMWNRR
jgi:alcohol dehydrogenase class IV